MKYFQIQLICVIIVINIGFAKFDPFIIKMTRQWGKKGEGAYNISISSINDTQPNIKELNNIQNKQHVKITLYDVYNNQTNFIKANITDLDTYPVESKIISRTQNDMISTRNNFYMKFSSLMNKSRPSRNYSYYGNRTGLFYKNNLGKNKLLVKNKNTRIYNINEYVFYGNLTGLYYVNSTVQKS